MKNPAKHTDVLIAGGGLAGMGLAFQLKNTRPDLDITILEKNTFPVPEGIAKVGESTVEIGSHYFSRDLLLDDHFEEKQLRKFGLRCFFDNGTGDFSEQDELGTSELFGVPTWQLDRGSLENELHSKLSALGVRFLDGTVTSNIAIGDKKHAVSTTGNDAEQLFESRWFIDAAGRQALLKKQLHLHKENDHHGNAVWFRIDRRIEIDNWSANLDWHKRIKLNASRWLSTNHLMGPGYWVWVIPLFSGVTSIGIVMDDHVMKNNDFASSDKAIGWLRVNQPRLANAIEGAKVLDYVAIENYSYGCKQALSSECWGLTGEAGYFSDPFYSPGSDFIAISNNYIKTLLLDDLAGKDIQLNAAIMQKFLNSFYQNTLSIYTGQYGGFGDRKMMSLKLLWDYSYYWGVLCLLFFQNTILDMDWMRKNSGDLLRASVLNTRVQSLFRERAKQRLVLPGTGAFIDQSELPCLHVFNRALIDADKNDPVAQLKINVSMLESIAALLEDMLESNSTKISSDNEKDLFANYREKIV